LYISIIQVEKGSNELIMGALSIERGENCGDQIVPVKTAATSNARKPFTLTGILSRVTADFIFVAKPATPETYALRRGSMYKNLISSSSQVGLFMSSIAAVLSAEGWISCGPLANPKI
jgi:hypothetical protein